MLKDQTKLISENEITGKGIIDCRTEYLGKCDYSLKIRKSRLKVNKIRSDKKIEETVFFITTMVGTITVDGNPYGSIYIKRNQLTLHLNEDFFMPICAFPSGSDNHTYKVYARVVSSKTKQVP